MYKVNNAKLLTSAPTVSHMPEQSLPEIALLGRSNVGKSSLINALLGRRSLARTSSQPGKTRMFNFYDIDEKFYLVDMPGYGYAKFARTERARLRKAIEGYVTVRQSLILVLQLVDFRHPPSADDLEFNQLLRLADIPFKVVATKQDKVPRSRHMAQKKLIATQLGVPTDELVLTSSETKDGLDALWAQVMANIKD